MWNPWRKEVELTSDTQYIRVLLTLNVAGTESDFYFDAVVILSLIFMKYTSLTVRLYNFVYVY